MRYDKFKKIWKHLYSSQLKSFPIYRKEELFMDGFKPVRAFIHLAGRIKSCGRFAVRNTIFMANPPIILTLPTLPLNSPYKKPLIERSIWIATLFFGERYLHTTWIILLIHFDEQKTLYIILRKLNYPASRNSIKQSDCQVEAIWK